VDATVIATIDRGFYNKIVSTAKSLERENSSMNMNDLKVNPPWEDLRSDLDKKLNNLIVSHSPSRKISGSLHEETGVGFIEGLGTVYRKLLNQDIKLKQAEKIIDPQVRAIVLEHLEQYGGDPKKAFAEDVTVFHCDGKTPIKRVRVLQSKTTLNKLGNSKFAVRDRQGKAFKWVAYGNMHHLEIVQDIQNEKVSGVFVTMMEAAKRAKGIVINKQPLVQTDHGAQIEFLMALHINDLVSLEVEGKRKFYRVQTLESETNRVMLRLHTASNLDNPSQKLHLTINNELLSKWHLKIEKINAIGKLKPFDDKTYD